MDNSDQFYRNNYFSVAGKEMSKSVEDQNKQKQESPAERFRRNADDQIESTNHLLNIIQPEQSTCDRIACDARQRLIEEVAQTPDAAKRECHEGCNSCCYSVSVDTTPLEAIHIANYIRENFSEEEVAAKHEKIAANAKAQMQLSKADRKHARIPCALLDEEGKCSVYEARPLSCAGAFSLSKDACIAAAQNASNVELSIPLDQAARISAMGVSGGLQKALVNAKIDGNLYELHTALNRALEIPHAEQRLLQGEDIFKGCVCTDRHSAPRLRADSGSVPKPKLLHKFQKNSDTIASIPEIPVILPINREAG